MSRIISVDVLECRVPTDRVLDFGSWILRDRDYTILRMRDASGYEGVAIGYSRNADIASTLRRNFVPFILDNSCPPGPDTFEKLYLLNRWVNQGGVFIRALSLIDIALWDLECNRLSRSLTQLLGSKPLTSPLTIACCYQSPDRKPSDDAAEAAELIRRGYRSLKVCAADGGEVDVRRLQAIRSEVGWDVELKLDLHWLWLDLDGKEPILRQFEELNLTWIEDAFPHERAQLLAELKQVTSLPIAYGDDQNGRFFFSELIEAGHIDVLRMDATVVGGVTEFLRVGLLANQHGMTVSGHVFSYLHAPLLGSLVNATNVERFEPDSGLDPIERLVDLKGEKALWKWSEIDRYKML